MKAWIIRIIVLLLISAVMFFISYHYNVRFHFKDDLYACSYQKEGETSDGNTPVRKCFCLGKLSESISNVGNLKLGYCEGAGFSYLKR